LNGDLIMTVSISLRIASVLVWISALGLGIPCLMAIKNLSAGHGIPFVFGFPAYGGGGFERHGIITTIPLLIGFLIICIAEAYSAWLLWGGDKTGAILALFLVVPGSVYWWGFDLPYPPAAALIRTILIVFSWTSLI
jgi:hypothetical protein